MEDGTYKMELCWFCHGMGVETTEESYEIWRRQYREALRRASEGTESDVAAFNAFHQKMSEILANYPVCTICGGECGIPERLLDDPNPLQQFFQDSDGWLRFDDELRPD